MITSLNKFFVYGTLRPDIIVSYSEIVHKNPKFTLKYSKAHLAFSKLFLNTSHGYPVTIHNKNLYTELDTVIGFILETDCVEETLKILDDIENYPREYNRLITNAYNIDTDVHEEVYFYSIFI